MPAVRGEPFFEYPGPAISVGDENAELGEPASMGVVVWDPAGPPSPNIINTGAAFNVEVQVRTAVPIPGGFPLPAAPAITVNFHINNALTLAPVAGSPFLGTPLTAIVAPLGDTGPRGPFDIVNWSNSTTAAGIILPAGTYRIIVHGHYLPAGLMFFHEGTVFHVGP